ncbi:MAG: hypothetical protein QM751_10405 [Paludibacteraceae bacterium]
MKTKLLLINIWLILLGFTAPIFATSTPAADDGKWYYVKSQRFSTGGPWWTFNITSNWVIPGALTKVDDQKFTLVSVGSSGNVTVKSYTGMLMTATNATGVFDAVGATTGWTITPNTVLGVTGTAFPGENSGLHQGGSSWYWHVTSGWYSLSDNCTFFFYEVKADVDLNIAIDNAITNLNSATIGTSIGQTPQTAVDNYQTAINTAKLTLGSTDATAIQNAIDALTDATNTFNSAKVSVVQGSTSTSPIWYLIKNTNRGGKGATLYTNGFNAQLKCSSVANSVKADGTSTGSAAPTLNHLFRFEKQADATYIIVNAALPNGEVLAGATGGSSSAIIKYGTPVSTKWNVNFIGYNTTLTVNETKFVSAGNGTVWHCDGYYNLVSWDGATGTPSAWYAEQYTGNVEALYQSQYDALVAQYNVIADANGLPVAPYTLGAEPGQYNAVMFQLVKDAYTAMENEKNINGITSPNIIQKFAALTSAIATFKASKVLPVAYAGSINTATSYTLKLVQSGSANDGYYLANPRIDANNGSDTNRPNAVFTQTIDPATTVWKFVPSATSGKYIITSARRTNEYLDEEGRVRDASSYGDNTYTTKTLQQSTINYTEGTSLLVVKIDQNSNYYFTGAASGATLAKDAVNWSTFLLELYVLTDTKSINNKEISLTVENRYLKVKGTQEDAKVYTLSGMQIDAKQALNPGIYIVKFNDRTFKVNVK